MTSEMKRFESKLMRAFESSARVHRLAEDKSWDWYESARDRIVTPLFRKAWEAHPVQEIREYGVKAYS